MEECKRDTQTKEKHHSNKLLSDGDNACSVSTAIRHKLERVDEEDEAAAEHEAHCWSVLQAGDYHWGQGPVYQAGTLQVHCKEMDNVPRIYPPGPSKVHSVSRFSHFHSFSSKFEAPKHPFKS